MIHQNCGQAVEAILKASVNERSLDNITVVVIAFKNYRKSLKHEIDQYENELKKQTHGTSIDRNDDTSSSNLIEDQHAAEQIENKRMNN